MFTLDTFKPSNDNATGISNLLKIADSLAVMKEEKAEAFDKLLAGKMNKAEYAVLEHEQAMQHAMFVANIGLNRLNRLSAIKFGDGIKTDKAGNLQNGRVTTILDIASTTTRAFQDLTTSEVVYASDNLPKEQRVGHAIKAMRNLAESLLADNAGKVKFAVYCKLTFAKLGFDDSALKDLFGNIFDRGIYRRVDSALSVQANVIKFEQYQKAEHEQAMKDKAESEKAEAIRAEKEKAELSEKAMLLAQIEELQKQLKSAVVVQATVLTGDKVKAGNGKGVKTA